MSELTATSADTTVTAPEERAARPKDLHLPLRVWKCRSFASLRTTTLIAALAAPLASRAQTHGDALCRPSLAPRAQGGPQVADTGFAPPLPHPAFAAGAGPHVMLDEAHNNFHTVEGRYAPFVKILRRDGYVVDPLRAPFTAASLAPVRILVIANAMATVNKGNWTLPTPSAFSADEIEALRRWVAAGGALLLIADHMPFGGSTADLASAFGVYMTNGFATDRTCNADEFVFKRSDKTLMTHPITRGRNAGERVDSVVSFTGQAFRGNASVRPLLVLAPETVLMLPVEAWKFSEATPHIPADGMLQGAALSYGRGRVAVFGEAAMFSAQVSGAERRPMGMNAPRASGNPQFLLNVLHWLSRLLPEH